MLSIGNKKYRNLQEQVGYNTQQIEKIFEILDGLNVQDNVVIVPDMSYILSEEELEIVNKEVAFIVYDNQLYIKKGQDASLAYFDIVFTISGSTTVISFNSKEIQVTLSNGALGIVVSSASTYNQTQIDSLLSAKASITYVDSQLASGLALKANLSGANFTGAITGPSIVENMSGYSFTKNASDTDKELDYLYAGVVKNGNKLTFVIFVKVTRKASIGVNSISLGSFTIPSAVGQNLHPYQGNWLNVLNVFASDTYVSGVEVPVLVTKGSNTSVSAQLNLVNTKLTQDTVYLVRLEQTFLLSDNLAQ